MTLHNTITPNNSQSKAIISTTISNIFAGESHSFDIGIAAYCGVQAAIIFNHIKFWIRQNKIKAKNFFESKTWMYQTYQGIQNYIPYLSKEQVKYSIEKLVRYGLIVKGNFCKNKFDRTNWYTISEDLFPNKIPDSNNSYERASFQIAKEEDQILTEENGLSSNNSYERATFQTTEENTVYSNSSYERATQIDTVKEESFSNNSYERANHLINSGSLPFDHIYNSKQIVNSLVPNPQEVDSCECELFNFFSSEILKRKPDFKILNRKSWVSECDKILRIDKRSLEKAKTLLSWIGSSNFWGSRIMSPESFRRNYDKIESQFDVSLKEDIARNNRNYANQVKAQQPEKMKGMKFDSKFVSNPVRSTEIPLDLPTEQFKIALNHMFECQTNIETEKKSHEDYEKNIQYAQTLMSKSNEILRFKIDSEKIMLWITVESSKRKYTHPVQLNMPFENNGKTLGFKQTVQNIQEEFLKLHDKDINFFNKK